MTDYSKSVVYVSADDHSVSVDGRKLVCLGDVPNGLKLLRWDSSMAWPGFAEDQNGEGHSFKDFDRVAPYVKLWEVAAAIDDETRAAAKAHAEAAERRRKAEEDAAASEHEAEVAKQRLILEAEQPIYDAQAKLSGSDYRIIKVMERLLVQSGELDASVAAEREAWRNVIRAKKDAS